MTGLEQTPTIVIGSGKGGVGKSVVSVLLASALAVQGRQVLLVDGDQNMANLHVLLGVRPSTRVESLLQGEIAAPDLVRPIAPNLWLLPGVSGSESLHGLDTHDRARIQHRLSDVYGQFDVVIVDAGSGIESVVRVATMHATRLLVVTAPEPTALTDAYALLKIVSLELPELPIDILVNRCLDPDEGRRRERHGRTDAAPQQAEVRLGTRGALIVGRQERLVEAGEPARPVRSEVAGEGAGAAGAFAAVSLRSLTSAAIG